MDTLIFDVFGTVVDEHGSLAGEADAALIERWTRRIDVLMDEVRAGEAPWRSTEALRREALAGEALPDDVVERLVRAGHRMKPWPDSPAALRALAGAFTVVALSNGTMAELVDLSAAGGLTWHCVLSAELVKAYKPDPAMYRLALDLLELDASRTLMVAAHPWDLRAAAAHGMRTAYVARPGEARPEPGDDFDFHADDLSVLAAQLI